MISNENDILQYETYNKVYIPKDYLKNSWTYRLNDNSITIITDSCSNSNCTCYKYNYKDNIISDSYTCSNYSYNSYAVIDHDYLTSDINYSPSITKYFFQDKLIFLFIICIGIIFARVLTRERSSY